MNDQARALAAISAWQPASICAELALSNPARAHLADTPSAPAWLAALLRAGCHRDAVTFLAHALPRCVAVRWACDCVDASASQAMSEDARAALAAARAWVREPTAARCRDAADAADRPCLESEGAARFAAFAAAWSGESLAPVGQPIVAPAPGLGACPVGAAVILAAARGAPSDTRGRLHEFVGRGMLSAGDEPGPPLPLGTRHDT